MSSPYRTWTSGDSATIWKPQIENQLLIHTRVLCIHVRWWFHLFIYEHHICMHTYIHTYIIPTIIHTNIYILHTYINVTCILAYMLILTYIQTYIHTHADGDLIHSLVNSYMIPYLHTYIRTYMYNSKILTCNICMFILICMHRYIL